VQPFDAVDRLQTLDELVLKFLRAARRSRR